MHDITLLEKISINIRDRWFYYITVPRYLSRIAHGDVVIDCGANVGKFTELFAKRGAVVYAFEPHPVAFAALCKKLESIPNVHCLNQAVSREAGRMKLFLRPDDDSIAATESSSLMASKNNVSMDRFVEVDVIRLVDFVRKLGHVRFIKMDIEGAEYGVLSDMLDCGINREVDYIVVETHERSVGLRSDHDELVARISRMGVKNIDLNWH